MGIPTASATAWHAERRKRILRANPEIRTLFGRHAATAPILVALVVLQLAFAAGSKFLSWPVVLLASYLVGTVVAHALGVLIHECTHNLVGRGTRANKAWAIVANLGLLAPAGIEFRAQHLLHHQYLGEADGRDTQAPTRREAELVGNSTFRKILSFTLGRFYYTGRPANKVARDGWLIANWVFVLLVDVALLIYAGPKSQVFLGVAGLAAFGPHPLGARRLSEHFVIDARQPTHSYYGFWNALSFNVGYHVEHHDFPAVSWLRLSALHAMAKRDYEDLHAFRSWTQLIGHYFFDRRYRVDQYIGMGGALESASQELEHPDHGELHPRDASSAKQESSAE